MMNDEWWWWWMNEWMMIMNDDDDYAVQLLYCGMHVARCYNTTVMLCMLLDGAVKLLYCSCSYMVQ